MTLKVTLSYRFWRHLIGLGHISLLVVCTLFTPGLVDLNRADFNHWFKSWLKSNDFCQKNHVIQITAACSLTLSVRAKQTILNKGHMHCLKLFQYSFVLFIDYESERALDTQSW